jgi:hypothetical protein
LYHPSSHGFICSRIGSGRWSAVNASSVIVMRRRGVKNIKLESSTPRPFRSMTMTGLRVPS